MLAIYLGTRGFGFALFEGQDTLVDWGVKSVTGDKSTQSLTKAKEMIGHYQPGVLVLENAAANDSRRSVRIRALSRSMIVWSARHNVKVRLFSRTQVKRVFFSEGHGTKQEVAERIAKRFPEELGFRLPPKRRPWMSEDYRMDIFNAIALALAYRLKRQKRGGSAGRESFVEPGPAKS